jgi:nitroreductase
VVGQKNFGYALSVAIQEGYRNLGLFSLIIVMNVFDAVTTWVPVKKFEKKPVDDKMIGLMLYMATHAESAGNLQGWEFIIVKDDPTKEKLYKAALRQDQIKSAPVCIVVCADLKKFSLKYQERGEFLYSIQDTASAITIILLTATALGLGSDLVRAFDEDLIKDILELPDDIRPMGIITIGYAKERPRRDERVPFDRLAWYDKYKQKYLVSQFFQFGPSPYKEDVFVPLSKRIKERIEKYNKKEKK